MRVEKLAVFRGLYLGDLIAAAPALRSLRRGYPGAEITLVSLPWAAALAPHLEDLVNRLVPYPGAPGLDGAGSAEELEEFLARARAERFDLAVNMHGRGPISTGLVARFGAQRTASFVGGKGSDVPALDVEVPWDAETHESRKLLLLAEKVGGAITRAYDSSQPELRVREEDKRRALALLRPRKPLALVHPGASVPEKRWPGETYGRVADSLVSCGYDVAVTGSAGEKELTRLVSEAGPGSLNLGGQTDLSTLIALVARASVVVSNDTGPAHLAYALRTPSVTLFGPSTDASRWGPLDGERHTVLEGNPISSILVEDVLRGVKALEARQERLGA
ncbi:MAG: glycosyltransferase family 9 protein [Actinomycetota bacterium]|nr:glycosyltransferase family 9 protein [Actinomycetota bacterium]